MKNEDNKIFCDHSKIKSDLKAAYDIYMEEQQIEVPKPDLSFMEDKKNSAVHTWKNIAKVAVLAMAILIASGGIAVWLNSESAAAAKFDMEKTFYKLSSGRFSTEEEGQVAVEDKELIFSIDNLENIDNAAKFLPEILYPYYVPEGYNLEELKITKRADLSYTIVYIYNNLTGNSFVMSILYIYDEKGSSSIYINQEAEIYQLEDRTLYVWEDSYFECNGITFMFDGRLIEITGNTSLQEMIEVCANVNRYEDGCY